MLKVAHYSEIKGSEAVRLELADILIYVVRLADKLDIDLAEAASEKIAINEEKYPADRVRGDARKYTEYVSHQLNMKIGTEK